MKNKKTLYFLIPLVVFIWGLIFYKIFAYMGDKNPDNLDTRSFNIKSDSIIEIDTFKLLANYDDPFLDKPYQLEGINEYQQNPDEVIKKEPVIPKKIEVKSLVPWPQVSYGGIIKNNISNKTIVIVNINGSGKIMTAGETVNGVLLKKIFKDSIIVEFNKETKIFKK